MSKKGLTIHKFKDTIEFINDLRKEKELDGIECFHPSANIKSCQYLNMLRFCEDRAFRNREEKCYVVCDEAYLLIDKKVPQAIEFMRNFSKRCRKYECGLITISQNILDCQPFFRQFL